MMHTTNIYQVAIRLTVGGKPVEFSVYSDIVDSGIPLVWFVEDWAAEARTFTPKSFCKYIMRRFDGAFVAMTKPQFDRMMQATNN
jgi:hypothetical protein